MSNTPVNVSTQEYAQLTNFVMELQGRIKYLEDQLSQQAPPAAPSREPKVADPEFFDGNRLHLRSFIAQLRLVLQSQPSRFPNERFKTAFAASYLRGPAFAWIQPYLDMNESPAILNNFELFVKELSTVFGDPDQVSAAERQLDRLRQTHSVSAYASEFRRLSSILGWNDESLRFQFYKGLKNDVKDELSRVSRPSSLSKLILLATKIDERIYDRLLEKRNLNYSSSTVGNSNYTRHSAPSSNVPASQSMDIDAVQVSRGPLSQDEKRRRRANNLCMYCGKPGHFAQKCPILPATPIIAAVSSTPGSAPSPVDNDPGKVHAQRQ